MIGISGEETQQSQGRSDRLATEVYRFWVLGFGFLCLGLKKESRLNFIGKAGLIIGNVILLLFYC